jgi:hypothetical protein
MSIFQLPTSSARAISLFPLKCVQCAWAWEGRSQHQAGMVANFQGRKGGREEVAVERFNGVCTTVYVCMYVVEAVNCDTASPLYRQSRGAVSVPHETTNVHVRLKLRQSTP